LRLRAVEAAGRLRLWAVEASGSRDFGRLRLPVKVAGSQLGRRLPPSRPAASSDAI